MPPSCSSSAGRGLVLLLAATLVGCRARDDKPLPAAPPGPSVAERIRVLNADVLIIDGRHIRLADAYAPQPIPDARCWAEALAAKQATQAVRGLVHGAQEIHVQPTGKLDSHNRQVAHVFLDRVDLARSLHDAGLVAEPPSGRFGWCEPISKGAAGAPALRALMDFSKD